MTRHSVVIFNTYDIFKDIEIILQIPSFTSYIMRKRGFISMHYNTKSISFRFLSIQVLVIEN